MYTAYIDMDGVLFDFDKAYRNLTNNAPFTKELFEICIMELKIFENLDAMPEFHLFKKLIEHYDHINFEILSSLGSPKRDEVTWEAMRQKRHCLEKYGINIQSNFVYHKGMKKWFATPNACLIDDQQQNIWDFNEHRGRGIHYDYNTKGDSFLKWSVGIWELDSLLSVKNSDTKVKSYNLVTA